MFIFRKILVIMKECSAESVLLFLDKINHNLFRTAEGLDALALLIDNFPFKVIYEPLLTLCKTTTFINIISFLSAMCPAPLPNPNIRYDTIEIHNIFTYEYNSVPSCVHSSLKLLQKEHGGSPLLTLVLLLS